MLPRFHVGSELGLALGQVQALPEAVSRHIQVLRLQPGAQVHLFDGRGQEWLATVTDMGRKVVQVLAQEALTVSRELPVSVTLAMGMPANDRMDALVEKAVELGVHAIQPLLCERSVLRLDGERAIKKMLHWQAVAVAACEQSGRTVVPVVHGIQELMGWLRTQGPEKAGAHARLGVLSLRDAVSIGHWLADATATGPEPVSAPSDATHRDDFVFLSGPEGGLSPAEEAAALSAGWTAVSLGRRVLRADTAPLAALSVIGARYEQGLVI